jgi:hypothetical protein
MASFPGCGDRESYRPVSPCVPGRRAGTWRAVAVAIGPAPPLRALTAGRRAVPAPREGEYDAGLPAVHAHTEGRSLGRRGSQPQAGRTGWLRAAVRRGHLHLPPAGLAGDRARKPHHPRGDGRHRRPGGLHAHHAPGRGVAADRPLLRHRSGDVPAERPRSSPGSPAGSSAPTGTCLRSGIRSRSSSATSPGRKEASFGYASS